jgi:hypothetical protein
LKIIESLDAKKNKNDHIMWDPSAVCSTIFFKQNLIVISNTHKFNPTIVIQSSNIWDTSSLSLYKRLHTKFLKVSNNTQAAWTTCWNSRWLTEKQRLFSIKSMKIFLLKRQNQDLVLSQYNQKKPNFVSILLCEKKNTQNTQF